MKECFIRAGSPLVPAACALMISVACAVASATVLRVPSEYATIQAGIDAADDGDTVLVAEGLYIGDGNRDIDFGGKAIAVASENGPEVTIINCQGTTLDRHRGFCFHSGEDHLSVLRGFMITNGFVAGAWPLGCGGGILCISSSAPTIVDNVIIGNRGDSGGGGIYCAGSSPMIVDNTIRSNTGDGGGGGISLAWSSPNIVDNEITSNWGYYGGGIQCWDDCYPQIESNTIKWNGANYGGGIFCQGRSSPLIVGNSITENTANWAGGGIGNREDSSPIIDNNTIIENLVEEGHGGGIYCTSSSPSITRSTIKENTAHQGGGIYCRWSSAIISGNTIAENTARALGGAISCAHDSSPTIVGNTISGNTVICGPYYGGGIDCCFTSSPAIARNSITGNAARYGAGISCRYSSAPAIQGNTIAENRGEVGGGVYCIEDSDPTLLNSIMWHDSAGSASEIFADNTCSLTVSYSDIEGGWPGEGNIDDDPAFVLAEREDYRLLWGSPCIDSGHPDSLDPDGTRSDMGAHFFDQDNHLTLYLTPDTTQVSVGGQLLVFYTVINRWEVPEEFWVLTGVITPEADSLLIMGPRRYVVPAGYTAQVPVIHSVPPHAPLGAYLYASGIGVPPATLYDEDAFELDVASP